MKRRARTIAQFPAPAAAAPPAFQRKPNADDDQRKKAGIQAIASLFPVIGQGELRVDQKLAHHHGWDQA